KSLQDNADFHTDATLDGNVTIGRDGRIVLTVRADPDNVMTVTRTAAATELVALKAIRGWYPGATVVVTTVMAHLSGTDTSAATIVVSLDTAGPWDLNALRVSTANDPEALFCVADHYVMDPEVWAVTGHWSTCLGGLRIR